MLSPELFPTEYEARNKQNRFRTPLESLITEVSFSAPRTLGFYKEENEKCIQIAVPPESNILPSTLKDQNPMKTTLILLPTQCRRVGG